MLRSSRLILFAFLTVVCVGCGLMASKFEKPTVSVANIELVSGNLLQQNFLVTFDIQNPNQRELSVTGLRAQVDVAGGRLASGVSNHPFVVPALGSSQFQMTITSNLAVALLRLGQRSEPADAIDYDMSGAVFIDSPFVHEIPFRQKGSFPLDAH